MGVFLACPYYGNIGSLVTGFNDSSCLKSPLSPSSLSSGYPTKLEMSPSTGVCETSGSALGVPKPQHAVLDLKAAATETKGVDMDPTAPLDQMGFICEQDSEAP